MSDLAQFWVAPFREGGRIQVLNPGAQTANITILFFDLHGKEMEKWPHKIPPTSLWYGGFWAEGLGWLRIRSDQPVAPSGAMGEQFENPTWVNVTFYREDSIWMMTKTNLKSLFSMS